MEIANILLLAFAAILYFNTCDGCFGCWLLRDPIESAYCKSDFVLEAKIVNYTDNYKEDWSDKSVFFARIIITRTYDIDIKHLYRHTSSYTTAPKQLRARIFSGRCRRELFLDHTYYIAGYISFPDVELAKTFLSVGACDYVVDLDEKEADLDLEDVKRLKNDLPTCA